MARLKALKTWKDDLGQDDAPTEEGRNRRARRRKILNGSAAARIYLPRIAALFALLDTIPGSYTDDEDRTTRMRENDRGFDSYAAAIWFLIEAYLRLIDLDPDLKRALRRSRDVVVPNLKITQHSWADEAVHARNVESELPTLQPDLALVPVVGGTLADWVGRLVTHGKAVGDDQADRALDRADNQADRSQVTLIRARIEGEVNRFRDTLADEAEDKKNDPDWRDAEALVFGYLDELTTR